MGGCAQLVSRSGGPGDADPTQLQALIVDRRPQVAPRGERVFDTRLGGAAGARQPAAASASIGGAAMMDGTGPVRSDVSAKLTKRPPVASRAHGAGAVQLRAAGRAAFAQTGQDRPRLARTDRLHSVAVERAAAVDWEAR